MPTSRPPVDAVVIGAGFSGLAAALRLAQFGKRVVVCEAHVVPGGLNSYYYRAPGKRLFNSGLHTFTNYRRGDSKWGRAFLFRSLGIHESEVELFPPRLPALIATPSLRLEVGNGFPELREQLSAHFAVPAETWKAFEAAIVAGSRDHRDGAKTDVEVLSELLRDRALIDLLRLPIYLYAGYREHSLPWPFFAGIFRSLWIDGYCSPANIKTLLDCLLRHLRECGAEVRYRSRVKRIVVERGAVRGVELANGEHIVAPLVISSAGSEETHGLVAPETAPSAVEQISAFETVLDFAEDTTQHGATHSLAFTSFREPFEWNLATLASGVPYATISVSDAYAGGPVDFPHHVKIGAFVPPRSWLAASPEAYAEMKAAKEQEMLVTLRRVFPALRPAAARLIESLTPATIAHYTGHPTGGLYGSAHKEFTGATGTAGLYLCGNDQGGIGIVGAGISGVAMANIALIQRSRETQGSLSDQG